MLLEHIKIKLAQNGPWIVLLLAIVVFSLLNPRFLSVNNAEVILRQSAELGIIALALAFVVMSGSIDLAVGSIASLAAVIASMVMLDSESLALGVVAGLGAGLALGAINGLLISYFGLNPIVVTLGFLAAWGGLALYLTEGKTLTGLPSGVGKFSQTTLGPFSLPVILLIFLVAISWFVLNHHYLGKWVLAIGENEEVAHLMGLPVKLIRFGLFCVSGFISALAGLLLVGKLQAVPPTLGEGAELNALTVVLLGGVAFAGGYGRVGGVVAGLLFVGVLRNGLVVIGVSQFLQSVAIGLTLVLAIALDGSLRRVVRTSWDALGESAPKAPHDAETSRSSS